MNQKQNSLFIIYFLSIFVDTINNNRKFCAISSIDQFYLYDSDIITVNKNSEYLFDTFFAGTLRIIVIAVESGIGNLSSNRGNGIGYPKLFERKSSWCNGKVVDCEFEL